MTATLLHISLTDWGVVEGRPDVIPRTFMPVDPFAADRTSAKSRNPFTDRPTSFAFTSKVQPIG